MDNKLINWRSIDNVTWTPVLNHNIQLGSHYKVVPTEGYIAWEYNPLRNYRLNENMYEKALISKYDYLSSKFYLQEL